ncbi:unnamed protein product, partial [Gulo gulo]
MGLQGQASLRLGSWPCMPMLPILARARRIPWKELTAEPPVPTYHLQAGAGQGPGEGLLGGPLESESRNHGPSFPPASLSPTGWERLALLALSPGPAPSL